MKKNTNIIYIHELQGLRTMHAFPYPSMQPNQQYGNSYISTQNLKFRLFHGKSLSEKCFSENDLQENILREKKKRKKKLVKCFTFFKSVKHFIEK